MIRLIWHGFVPFSLVRRGLPAGCLGGTGAVDKKGAEYFSAPFHILSLFIFRRFAAGDDVSRYTSFVSICALWSFPL